MGGSGMGFAYVPPLVQYVIDTYDWRAGYICLAIFTVVVDNTPGVFFFCVTPRPHRAG